MTSLLIFDQITRKLYESRWDYWDGYKTALKRVIKMWPDNEVDPEEDYD
jgi:hypothetical protein